MKKILYNTIFFITVLLGESLTAYTIYKQCYKRTPWGGLRPRQTCECPCFAYKQMRNGRCARCGDRVIISQPHVETQKK